MSVKLPEDSEGRPPGVRVTAAKCVRCGRQVNPRVRPFCSQRCSDIDLGSWFRGTYRVATDDEPDLDPEQDPEQDPPVDNSPTER